MVYESDFYTTRRPYSRPTPSVTSYSVTNPRLTPAVGKAHTYHPSIPYIAHKKMNNVTTPVPHNQVRRSVISNTIDRIHHKPRSMQSYDPTEDFLNERHIVSFEDVSRSIRANTAALLKKVNTPIPRAIRPHSLSDQYSHIETPISERIASDEYIWHLLRPLPGKPSNGIDVGYYPETSTRVPLGKTHLACLSYAGGHPISRRRQLVAGPGDEYRNVRNDVELLSHYHRMREAANHPLANDHTTSKNHHEDFTNTTPTSSYKTEKVIPNGTHLYKSDEEKENEIPYTAKKPLLKKKLSKDKSVDDLNDKVAEEKQKAEEKRNLEKERKLKEERRLEEERKFKEEQIRLEEKRKLEEKLIREEKQRLEEERLEEERRLEEQRKAEEEQQRLEEELLKEYHREQEEKRKLEQQFAEEQQRLAQEKLEQEQKLLHDKLMQYKEEQDRLEQNKSDYEEETEEPNKECNAKDEEEDEEEEESVNEIPNISNNDEIVSRTLSKQSSFKVSDRRSSFRTYDDDDKDAFVSAQESGKISMTVSKQSSFRIADRSSSFKTNDESGDEISFKESENNSKILSKQSSFKVPERSSFEMVGETETAYYKSEEYIMQENDEHDKDNEDNSENTDANCEISESEAESNDEGTSIHELNSEDKYAEKLNRESKESVSKEQESECEELETEDEE